MMKGSKAIREEFIEFFKQRDHFYVEPSSVVPKDDPTLLFTNAGMNQFKDVFLGIGVRPYKRAVNSQKCIRVSGKHNDLEEVGVDTYHHTFFEMLGNWSFGDYFKAEAIKWAWQLLTEVWKIPKERLYATVFGGDERLGLEPDNESAELWKRLTDIEPTHILQFGMKDNFWQMADVGPCGPCSEIHIDLTADKSGRELINKGDPRVIEIWNLVFIQFNMEEGGRLTSLPSRHVDTGMGLERICAVLKHLDSLREDRDVCVSNYGTDLFVPIIQQIESITGKEYGKDSGLPDRYDSCDCNTVDVACRVIADHIRTLTFAISEGVIPSNEGRGYVIRRILRRAARFGRKLDMHQPFIYKLVPTVVEIMGDAFPEIKDKVDFVASAIKAEEEAFGRTLDRGIEIFEAVADDILKKQGRIFPGSEAFKLYDTYGFPLDLTELMAREKGLVVDREEFDQLMEEQRRRAKEAEAQRSSLKILGEGEDLERLPKTDDSYKYDPSMRIEANILGLVIDGKFKDEGTLEGGEEGFIITDKTCFYAESGGQVGDSGLIRSGSGVFLVLDTQKVEGTVLHKGKVVEGKISVGDAVELIVDSDRRKKIMCNHTATHLLQWALREVLGEHVRQAGSYVSDEYFRFDFTHHQAMSEEQIHKTEELVISKIDQACKVVAKAMPIEEALKLGVIALFGEKYGDVVRVVAIGAESEERLDTAFSRELCGGTHIDNTAAIMDFKILKEESLQTGVRRITAKTSKALRDLMHARYDLVERLVKLVKSPPEGLYDRINAIMQENRQLKKVLQEGKAIDLTGAMQSLLSKSKNIGSATFIAGELPFVPVDKLRGQIDWLRKKAKNLVAVLATKDDSSGKVQLIAAVDENLIKKGLSAVNIIKEISGVIEGKGGGKDHLAQAGGKAVDKLEDALRAAEEYVKKRVAELEGSQQ